MPETVTPPSESNEPDFLFGGNRVVSEAEWEQLHASGIENVYESLDEADTEQFRRVLAREREIFGAENVLLGDAFDAKSGRPLRHKPGTGVYATPEGLEREQELAKQGKLGHLATMVLPDGRIVVVRPRATTRPFQRVPRPGTVRYRPKPRRADDDA